ncbi:MAG: SH3 domain-containing protein [Rickettsiaceae bacterium]
MNKLVLSFLAVSFYCSLSVAGPTDLPVPRFVTIKFDEVNARTGPESDCPIEWVFIKKGEPVEVIAEYGQWRKIKDISDEGGWVHSSVISGNRSVIVIAKNVVPLLSSPGKHDKVIAKLSPQLRCNLHKCQSDWCQVSCKSYKGWVARKSLWGIYPEEAF